MEIMILIELVLWIIVDISLFSISIVFLLKGFKEESKSTKFFFLTICFFFLCTGIQRIFSIVFDFFYPEFFFLFLITLLNIISVIPLLNHLEKTVIHTKRVLSFIVILLVIIFVLFYFIIGYDRIIMYYFFVPPFLIAIGSIGSIYIYLLIKSSGKVRSSVALIILGISMILIFWLIHSQYGRSSVSPILELVDIIGIIAPIGYLMGLVVLAFGFFQKRG